MVTPMRCLPLLAVLAPLLAPAAHASPWTLPAGRLVLSAGMNYQFATEEFQDAGGSVPFSLRGAYRGQSLTLGLRAGFTERVEFELQVPFTAVSYAADPVILLDGGAGSGRDFYQENVIDLSRTTLGVGDLVLATRVRLNSPGATAVALELRLKAPTGYERPAGTFGERPSSAAELAGDLARFVRPENVRDDVTLGDGQLDLAASLHAGHAFAMGTFVRASAGYNRRFAGAGDQVIASLRAGHRLSPRWLVFAGVQGARSVTRGRVIGVSVAAIDPELPASAYGGVENLALREVRLERDLLEAGGGLILKLTPEIEANLAAQTMLWGRNVSRVTSTTLTFAWQLPL
jgi:hypothetical protein